MEQSITALQNPLLFTSGFC